MYYSGLIDFVYLFTDFAAGFVNKCGHVIVMLPSYVPSLRVLVVEVGSLLDESGDSFMVAIEGGDVEGGQAALLGGRVLLLVYSVTVQYRDVPTLVGGGGWY